MLPAQLGVYGLHGYLASRINGLLTWIGKGFGIHELTLQLIIGYLFYPITFLIGVPRPEILRVSRLLATKLVANEFVAYLDLQKMMEEDPLSHRAYTIASYGLCGFANMGSLGIQIGVLGALAPSKSKVIARIAVSAMICGFLSTLQSAGIVCVAPSVSRETLNLTFSVNQGHVGVICSRYGSPLVYHYHMRLMDIPGLKPFALHLPLSLTGNGTSEPHG